MIKKREEEEDEGDEKNSRKKNRKIKPTKTNWQNEYKDIYT